MHGGRTAHEWESAIPEYIDGAAASQPAEIQDQAAALQNETYWRNIRERWCWTDDKAANLPAWEKILTDGPPGREMMMTEEERDYLASLPDVITVYRGYPGAEGEPVTGWSWTLDRHVALCFAWRWGPHPRLAAGTVRRDRVVAFINSPVTEEMEIIVNPADVTITACHPVTGDAPWLDDSLAYDEEDDPYVLGSSS